MKITTKANIGDCLYFLYEPNQGDWKWEVKKEKVLEIKVLVKKDEIYEAYTPESRYGEFYINNGEYSAVFVNESEAKKEAEKSSDEYKKEIEEEKKWRKEYEKDNAVEEIKKIAKKNKIKIEIK